jgi:hypothetical protein
MYDVQDFNAITDRAIEYQVLFKAPDTPYTDSLQGGVFKLTLRADVRRAGQIMKCLVAGL